MVYLFVFKNIWAHVYLFIGSGWNTILQNVRNRKQKERRRKEADRKWAKKIEKKSQAGWQGWNELHITHRGRFIR